jgi:hypothetical protein
MVLWKIDNRNFDNGISAILTNFKNCLAPSPLSWPSHLHPHTLTLIPQAFFFDGIIFFLYFQEPIDEMESIVFYNTNDFIYEWRSVESWSLPFPSCTNMFNFFHVQYEPFRCQSRNWNIWN